MSFQVTDTLTVRITGRELTKGSGRLPRRLANIFGGSKREAPEALLRPLLVRETSLHRPCLTWARARKPYLDRTASSDGRMVRDAVLAELAGISLTTA